MRDAMELLVEQITVFSPIHDLIGTNLAHRQDALDYLQGKIDSPFSGTSRNLSLRTSTERQTPQRHTPI